MVKFAKENINFPNNFYYMGYNNTDKFSKPLLNSEHIFKTYQEYDKMVYQKPEIIEPELSKTASVKNG